MGRFQRRNTKRQDRETNEGKRRLTTPKITDATSTAVKSRVPTVAARDAFMASSSNPIASAASFLDKNFYATGVERSVNSYQRYLESVVHGEHGLARETVHGWRRTEDLDHWPPNVLGKDRIIELDDDDSESSKQTNLKLASLDNGIKDSRAPTLEKMLNSSTGTEKVAWR